ncbi:hypothetical protein AVEN_181110-1 [Araneus ventricosus]|uniref:RNase H type-1 domain-containing protein n=1 Tax=Araneus ventricosus TaxID=182803 RepID=A0A4Y2LNF8_ARAVE|nr:hypothetical protein AVEN_181110-1 [Araneus ventricosus]
MNIFKPTLNYGLLFTTIVPAMTGLKYLSKKKLFPTDERIEFPGFKEALHIKIVKVSYNIIIYTDSLSSILALQRACLRSGFVNKAKVDFLKAKHLVGLSWVKARVGNEGNDLADQQAKLSTIIGEDYDIPVP